MNPLSPSLLLSDTTALLLPSTRQCSLDGGLDPLMQQQGPPIPPERGAEAHRAGSSLNHTDALYRLLLWQQQLDELNKTRRISYHWQHSLTGPFLRLPPSLIPPPPPPPPAFRGGGGIFYRDLQHDRTRLVEILLRKRSPTWTGTTEVAVTTGLPPTPQHRALNAVEMIHKKKQPPPAAAAAADAATPTSTMGRPAVFPKRLHQALMDLEARGEEGRDIAAFLSDGRSFSIYRPREFVQQVLPKYFNTTRFASFQRQLNLYRFRRITHGPDQGAYYHELFHKDSPNLASRIRRDNIVSTGQLPVHITGGKKDEGQWNQNSSGIRSATHDDCSSCDETR